MDERPLTTRHAPDAPGVMLGPNRVTFLVGGADTGDRASLTEFALAPARARRADGSSELGVTEGIGSTGQRHENTPLKFDRTVRLDIQADSPRDVE